MFFCSFFISNTSNLTFKIIMMRDLLLLLLLSSSLTYYVFSKKEIRILTKNSSILNFNSILALAKLNTQPLLYLKLKNLKKFINYIIKSS